MRLLDLCVELACFRIQDAPKPHIAFVAADRRMRRLALDRVESRSCCLRKNAPAVTFTIGALDALLSPLLSALPQRDSHTVTVFMPV
jgi:hypothetical protein